MLIGSRRLQIAHACYIISVVEIQLLNVSERKRLTSGY
jgi:hypothetical protein